MPRGFLFMVMHGAVTDVPGIAETVAGIPTAKEVKRC